MTEEELRTLFSEHGEVLSLSIVRDRYSGRPRGFGLVEFANNENAQKAKHALKGRALQVEDAREQRRGRGPSDYGRRSRY